MKSGVKNVRLFGESVRIEQTPAISDLNVFKWFLNGF